VIRPPGSKSSAGIYAIYVDWTSGTARHGTPKLRVPTAVSQESDAKISLRRAGSTPINQLAALACVRRQASRRPVREMRDETALVGSGKTAMTAQRRREALALRSHQGPIIFDLVAHVKGDPVAWFRTGGIDRCIK
jgi:hypothetical protein